MVATEDAAAERIGKIDFTVRVTKEQDDADERRQRRIESLTRWLLAQWRLEHGERYN
jgi:hypothetical protein